MSEGKVSDQKPTAPKASDVSYHRLPQPVSEPAQPKGEIAVASDAHPVTADNAGRAGRSIPLGANLEAIAAGQMKPTVAPESGALQPPADERKGSLRGWLQRKLVEEPRALDRERRRQQTRDETQAYDRINAARRDIPFDALYAERDAYHKAHEEEERTAAQARGMSLEEYRLDYDWRDAQAEWLRAGNEGRREEQRAAAAGLSPEDLIRSSRAYERRREEESRQVRKQIQDRLAQAGNAVRDVGVEAVLHAGELVQSHGVKDAIHQGVEAVLPRERALTPAEGELVQQWDRATRLRVVAEDPQIQRGRAGEVRRNVNYLRAAWEGLGTLGWLGVPFTSAVSSALPVSGETMDTTFHAAHMLQALSKTFRLGWHIPNTTPDVKTTSILKREGLDLMTCGLIPTAFWNAREQSWHDAPAIEVGKSVRALVDRGAAEYSAYAQRRAEIDAAIQTAMEWKVPKDAPQEGKLPWFWSPKRDRKQYPTNEQLAPHENDSMKKDPLTRDVMKDA